MKFSTLLSAPTAASVLALFFCLTAPLFLVAQSSPIAQRIAKAQQDKANFVTQSLFQAPGTVAAAQIEGLDEALYAGTVLEWNALAGQTAKQQAAEYLELPLPRAGAKALTLQLFRANFFTPDFQVRASSNPDAPITDIDGIHYWGVVKGQPGALAAISIYADGVMGFVNLGDARYVLGPIENDPARRHIFYRDADLKALPDFTCFTDDEAHYIGSPDKPADVEKDANNCVKMYVETDYDLFVNKGSVANVTNYMTGVFSQVAILYANESINFTINELFVWNTTDPYTGTTTSNYLTQFRNAKNGVYNGNLAHLVGLNGGGGVAYLDVLCNAYYGVGYSAIQATYSNVPTYSWTVEVLTHEIGHNLGSPHTHACAWNGNNTAIDGCGPAAGYSEGCNASVPTQGTIMSYCHLVSGVGINFNLGFGPQPGDLIRNRVYNASCLTACGGGGGECTDNEVTVSITLDNYPGETTWQITNSSGTVVASGGPYSSAGATVTATPCLPDGCYNFTIFDSYGDGLCCSYGNGSYIVTDAGGNTLASGASFTSSQTTAFCVPDGGGGGCTYSTLNTANFDSGWGIWTDGGTDCARINNATYASSGTYSIQLRDNTTTSVMSTSNQNYSAYSELTVTFSSVSVSFENNEDFWLQISTNGGSTYTTVGDFNAGSTFVNGARYNGSVVIPGPFTSNTRLRFRADASADDDVVYIDDVVITGCGGGALVGGTPTEGPENESVEQVFDPVYIFPNPASEQLTVVLTLEEAQEVELLLTDIAGRPIWRNRAALDRGKQPWPIQVSELAPGAYQLIVVADGLRTTRSFVIAR